MTPCIHREGDTITLWSDGEIIKAVGLVATDEGVARILLQRDPGMTTAQHEQAIQRVVGALSVRVAAAISDRRASQP